MGRIEIVLGDITLEDVDAIVNAANETLLGGGGVDGAIHRAAGPELLAECRTLGGCPTGESRVTRGYRLKALWVIHTVGPIWRGGQAHEESLLTSCYYHCLDTARKRGFRTLAFPSISTGAYGFPVERAAKIALGEITSFLASGPTPERIRLVCFDPATLGAYQDAFGIR